MKLKNSLVSEVEMSPEIEQTQPQSQPQSLPKRKRVGILGGGFNPVHTGHLIISDQVSHQLDLDEFYLMPSYQSPHLDKKETIASEHRVEMLKLAIQDNSRLSLDLCEVVRKGKSYTYDTIKELIERNQDTDYYFVVGGDMVAYLPKWYKINELVNMVQFVGVHRKGIEKETPYSLIWVDCPLVDISSTVIRKKIANGCSVKYLLPDSVIDYIHEKGLYQNDSQFNL